MNDSQKMQKEHARDMALKSGEGHGMRDDSPKARIMDLGRSLMGDENAHKRLAERSVEDMRRDRGMGE